MVVVGSGFTAFPLKAYTEPERKAFRGSDPRLNFAGGIEKAKARYGVTITSPPAFMTPTAFKTLLNRPGLVVAVAGKLANFPTGHPLRRWQPAFLDFHAVAVVTLGNGKVVWLDPLAPNLYAGDAATVADVADTFARGNYPNDARYMKIGGSMPNIENIPQGYPAGTKLVLEVGSYQGWNYSAGGVKQPFTVTLTKRSSVDTTALVKFVGESAAFYVPRIYVAPTGYRDDAYLVPKSAADPQVVLPPAPPAPDGISPEELAEEKAKSKAEGVAEGAAARDAEWEKHLHP
jgi:hypothetical protein